MTNNRKRVAWLLSACTGLIVGIIFQPSAARAEDICEFNYCNTKNGDCGTTDARLSCSETDDTPFCKSRECDPIVVE